MIGNFNSLMFSLLIALLSNSRNLVHMHLVMGGGGGITEVNLRLRGFVFSVKVDHFNFFTFQL